MAYYETPFSKRCEIMAHANAVFLYDKEWQPLLSTSGVGIGLAHCMVTGIIKNPEQTVTIDGFTHIESAWQNFAEFLGLDDLAEYESLEQMLELAGRPQIEGEEE